MTFSGSRFTKIYWSRGRSRGSAESGAARCGTRACGVSCDLTWHLLSRNGMSYNFLVCRHYFLHEFAFLNSNHGSLPPSSSAMSNPRTESQMADSKATGQYTNLRKKVGIRSGAATVYRRSYITQGKRRENQPPSAMPRRPRKTHATAPRPSLRRDHYRSVPLVTQQCHCRSVLTPIADRKDQMQVTRNYSANSSAWSVNVTRSRPRSQFVTLRWRNACSRPCTRCRRV